MFLYSATVYGTLPGGGWVSPTITTADAGVWAVVGASGGAGDVGLTVAAVVADRRVTERGEHGGAVAGLGLVSVFTQRDVPDVVDAVLDVPLRPRPCAEIGGLGVLGGQ